MSRANPAQPLLLLLALPLVLTLAAPAHAAWTQSGSPVCVAPGAQYAPSCQIPWIGWTDERSGVPQAYALRFSDFTGAPLPGSPLNGLPVAPSTHAQLDIRFRLDDWDGSLWVAWTEDRGTGSGLDVYLTRLTINGDLTPGWPADGLLVCGATGDQRAPSILPNNHNVGFGLYEHTAYVSWEDSRDGVPALRAASIRPTGVPDPRWLAGNDVLVSTGSTPIQGEWLIANGAGFVAVYEQDAQIVARAVDASGQVLASGAWSGGGRVLNHPSYPAANIVAIENSLRQVLVVWEETRPAGVHLRAQTWHDSLGDVLTLNPGGIDVSDDGFLHLAQPHDARLFEAGGDFAVVWRDTRNDAGDLYANRVHVPYPSGPAYASLEGASVVAPGMQSSPPSGLVWSFFWVDTRAGTPRIFSPYSATGSPNGSPLVNVASSQTQVSASHRFGAYIPESPPRDVAVWTDSRNADTGPDLYAQVMGPGGPGTVGVPGDFPIAVSLSNSRPTPTRGAVSFGLELPSPMPVRFVIVDVSGREVAQLAEGTLAAGRQVLAWDGRGPAGQRVRPGIYWLRGTIGGQTLSRRVVMLAE